MTLLDLTSEIVTARLEERSLLVLDQCREGLSLIELLEQRNTEVCCPTQIEEDSHPGFLDFQLFVVIANVGVLRRWLSHLRFPFRRRLARSPKLVIEKVHY